LIFSNATDIRSSSQLHKGNPMISRPSFAKGNEQYRVGKMYGGPRSRARGGRDPGGSRAETRAKTRVNRRLRRHAPYLP
ncbi:hypothetical protein ALC62_00605, partial [Cyphomyrmex costatus]